MTKITNRIGGNMRNYAHIPTNFYNKSYYKFRDDPLENRGGK